MHTARGYAAHLAAQVKAAVNIPVFAAGRIIDTAQAEHILAEEQADGVEMIRALIADPRLPLLSQNGRAHDARPCISCNQGCQVRNVMNAALACSVNPDVIGKNDDTQSNNAGHNSARETGREPVRDLGRESGRDKSHPYIIIGGGPAGMEAARAAALRGRYVVLYEREPALGGAVALAAKAPGRGELQLITHYLQRELAKLNVEIQTGVEVTADMVVEQHPQAVIVATGAQSGCGLLPIPGHDLPHVTAMRCILRGDPVTGQRVVIIDESGAHGVYSVAELLAAQGHVVEIVTEDWYVGHDLTATHDIVPGCSASWRWASSSLLILALRASKADRSSSPTVSRQANAPLPQMQSCWAFTSNPPRNSTWP